MPATKATPIADAGFIVGLRSKNAAQREWAIRCLEENQRPFLTCEVALAEAAHFCGADFVCALLEKGEIAIGFDLQEQLQRICALVAKYGRQMDLADACIVRMTELFPEAKVFTVDGKDFSYYRKNGDELIPVEIGPV